MIADNIEATQTLTTVAPEAVHTPQITGFTTIWGITVNPSLTVLVIVLGTIAFLLWKAQRDQGKNTFDVWDLVMDTLPDGRRQTSGIKTTYQFAFLLSSWVVVDNQIKGTLTEGMFGLYLATWCASLIAKVVFDKKDPLTIPGGGK